MSSAAPVARVAMESHDAAFSASGCVVAGTFVITVTGEVDFATASQTSTAPLDDAYVASGSADILVDLSGVTFLDSGGLSWLVRLRLAARSRGGSVRLVGVPPRIERMLRISGVLPLFAA